MNALNLEMVNSHAEYPVFLSQTGKYVFKTDNDILYAVDFELDSNPYYTAYWFNLTNPEHVKSPGDVKIAQTVVCIIDEFDLPKAKTIVKKASHWDIGQTWEST